tara:strand:- start:3106 stop:3606 length:501 start_codon:yes stop_codon:yes gene_type:complete
MSDEKNINKVASEGISFTNTRNWDRDEPSPEPDVEIPAEPEPAIDEEYIARQEKLQVAYENAKTINYSGMALNGTGLWAMVFGISGQLSSPEAFEMVNSLNDTFGLGVDYQAFIDTLEEWKGHLISLMVSSQTAMVWYQDIRSKMKKLDSKDSFLKFVNDELGRLI